MKEVVIKISDAMYKYITMEHSICIKDVGEYLFGLVRCTGTLLPEGHGDLIDRKELTKYPPIWMEDKRRTGEDDAVILLSDILKAEAIIKGEHINNKEVNINECNA